MNNVVSMRPFKFPRHKVIDSDFVPSRKEECEEFMLEDLAKSGLTPDDIGACVHGRLALPQFFTAGYVIGYTLPSGGWVANDQQEIVMWRTRLKPMDGFVPKQRYDQPSAKELAQHNLSGSLPYIPPAYHEMPPTDTIAICEGEKKAAAVMKYLGVSAIGIGGCWSWRSGKDDGGVHPWILELVRRHKHVLIIPDGDYHRYQISKAYGTLCSEMTEALEDWGGDIGILDCPDKIDDLIVKWGPEAEDNFQNLPRLDRYSLVEDAASLVKQYGLSFTVTGKGVVKAYENSSNVQILMERHPAFDKIWLDMDRDRIMIGDQEVIPDHTEMEVANHFQHHLSMPTVKAHDVYKVMMSLSKQHAKSPFLDWIEAQVWDGKPRLDTYMIRHMGADDNQYTREVSSKFLIASVARQRRPGCKFDWMMITTGPQGIGKSSLARILWRGNMTTIVGDHGGRDMMMKLHTGLCIVIDELDALNKKESEFWKSVIATNVDVYRAPYGRADVRKERRSVLYGTTNSDVFLMEDASGMRRYMPVRVRHAMDQDEFALEVPQLWAEAAHREKLGLDRYWEVDNSEVIDQYVSIDDTMGDTTDILSRTARERGPLFTFYRQTDGGEVFCLTSMEMRTLLEGVLGKEYFGKGVKQKDLHNHMVKLGFERAGGRDTLSGKGRPWRIDGPALEALKSGQEAPARN